MKINLLICGFALAFVLNIVQGKESTPLEDEEPQIRIVLNNKLKKLVPDKEAEEVAAIYDGILQEHNETLARESLAHFVVFAVQNKVSANRDDLFQAVNKSISKGDLRHLEELLSGSDNYQELKSDLQETLTAETVRKVTDFLEEFNRMNRMKPNGQLRFITMYMNYAVPDKMKVSVDQFLENESELNLDHE